jgi:hypothetical protein
MLSRPRFRGILSEDDSVDRSGTKNGARNDAFADLRGLKKYFVQSTQSPTFPQGAGRVEISGTFHG